MPAMPGYRIRCAHCGPTEAFVSAPDELPLHWGRVLKTVQLESRLVVAYDDHVCESCATDHGERGMVARACSGVVDRGECHHGVDRTAVGWSRVQRMAQIEPSSRGATPVIYEDRLWCAVCTEATGLLRLALECV